METDPFTVPAGGRFGLPRTTVVTNTLATLPGTDPSRILVVSGHLDSRGSNLFDGVSDAPGANDDASGVAAVLEAARAMAPLSFRATVIFMAVSGEEQGLIGSRHWAAAAHRTHLPIEAMLDNDIIGSSQGGNGVHDDRHVRLFSTGGNAVETLDTDRTSFRDGENDSPSRQLSRAVAGVQRRCLPGFAVVPVHRHDRLFRGGDHLAFNEQGYAAVRFTEINEDLRHQHQDVRVQGGVQFGDLLQFLDFAYLASVTRLNLATLADLAWAPPPPENVRLVLGPAGLLATDTTLRWDRAADPDRLGFELLWRETAAPDWQGEQFVGESNEATLPLSRDDFFFAVRAVSRAGNRSLPVIASSGG